METSSSFFSLSGRSSSSSKWIPRRNSSWGIEAQDSESNRNQQWTAVERAERVARDSALLSLLEVEVGKSGVVTAAGYKAVHQKFLYSDVVEEEMNRWGLDRRRTTTHLPEAPKTRRGSLFGDLVKSIQHSCNSNDVIMAMKISSGSDGASVDHHDPLSSSTSSDRNLAPRRASINMESPAPSVLSLSDRDKEDLQDLHDNVDSLSAKYSFSEVRWEDDDASSVDSISSERSYTDECGWLPWPLKQG